MKNYNLIKAIFFVVLLSVLLSSCKNADSIGIAALPPGDQLHLLYSDTNSVFTTTIHDVPLVTSSTTLDIKKTKVFVNLLGANNDPVFGSTQASFYTQFVLNDSLKISAVLPKSPSLYESGYMGFKVDSVILALGYFNLYGDSEAVHKVVVHRLTEAIDRTASYTKSSSFKYDADALAHIDFKPHLKDSVLIGGQKEAPQLKMRLTSLESKIQTAVENSLNNSVGSLADIISGIYVTSSPAPGSGAGSVVYFNLGGASTSIGIFYHITAHLSDKRDKSFQKDSIVYQGQNLVVNGACARVTNFSTRESSVVSNAIDNPQKSDSVLYLKSLGVSKVKILMPFLKTYFNKGYIINKAELQVFADPASVADSKFPPPEYLEVSRIGDLNESQPIADKIESSGYGGYYNASSQLYSFTITRHVQSLVNGKLPNNGLYLEFGSDQKTSNAARVILTGGKSSSRKMRLLLTYTKI